MPFFIASEHKARHRVCSEAIKNMGGSSTPKSLDFPQTYSKRSTRARYRIIPFILMVPWYSSTIHSRTSMYPGIDRILQLNDLTRFGQKLEIGQDQILDSMAVWVAMGVYFASQQLLAPCTGMQRSACQWHDHAGMAAQGHLGLRALGNRAPGCFEPEYRLGGNKGGFPASLLPECRHTRASQCDGCAISDPSDNGSPQMTGTSTEITAINATQNLTISTEQNDGGTLRGAVQPGGHQRTAPQGCRGYQEKGHSKNHQTKK